MLHCTRQPQHPCRHYPCANQKIHAGTLKNIHVRLLPPIRTSMPALTRTSISDCFRQPEDPCRHSQEHPFSIASANQNIPAGTHKNIHVRLFPPTRTCMLALVRTSISWVAALRISDLLEPVKPSTQARSGSLYFSAAKQTASSIDGWHLEGLICTMYKHQGLLLRNSSQITNGFLAMLAMRKAVHKIPPGKSLRRNARFPQQIYYRTTDMKSCVYTTQATQNAFPKNITSLTHRQTSASENM